MIISKKMKNLLMEKHIVGKTDDMHKHIYTHLGHIIVEIDYYKNELLRVSTYQRIKNKTHKISYYTESEITEIFNNDVLQKEKEGKNNE